MPATSPHLPWEGLHQGSIVLRHELTIGIATPSNNEIRGMHYLAYRTLRRQWQILVRAALRGEKPAQPIPLSFLIINRYCSGAGLDWDNAYGGLKPLLDCLVTPSQRNPDGLGLIEDDNLKAMPYPPYFRQFTAKPKQSRTEVAIFELIYP